jgi:hypothetical protein
MRHINGVLYKVCSVAIDLRSVYGSTGLLSMPLAFSKSQLHFTNHALQHFGRHFGQRLYRSNARQRLEVHHHGNFLIESGFKKART